MTTIGRNSPCWCGSGKKYKKCHMLTETDKNKPNLKPGQKIMTNWIKTAEEIEKMRAAGQFNGQLMDYIRTFVKAGISTAKIDKLIYEYTIDHGHIPACLNYRGYPNSSCISINEVVCHGIPESGVILREGDIVNVDITSVVDGFFGDQSETFLIEPVAKEAKSIAEAAADSMIKGIYTVKPGTSFADIGTAIQNFAHANQFSVVVDFTGHGIGKKFHEDPPIYHFMNNETKPYVMAAGMTFTIEPMLNQGTWRVEVDKKNKWTVRTLDKKLSAQFEHTILVTETGFEILTLPPSLKEANKISLLGTIPENNLE